MYDDLDDIDESMVELNDEASYVCGSCGEDIVVPVDSSEGRQQQYVEDCPVCCCPNVIYVEIEEDGFPNVRSHRRERNYSAETLTIALTTPEMPSLRSV